MKKKGYTIAEAIITMGIIGVVASLSIPTFISSYRKQVYSKTLASAVSTFENGMSVMMMKEGADDLLDSRAWSKIKSGAAYSLSKGSSSEVIEDFMKEIGGTLSIETYETADAKYSSLSDPGAAPSITYGSPVRFRTRSGLEYMIYVAEVSAANAKKEVDVLAAGGNYQNQAAEVYIDVNGVKEPNVIGRDYFRFELGTDGRLYPYGSKEQCLYSGTTYADVREKCVVNKEGYYCAAHLAQNAYKMDY